ncbi:nuclear transport factor 2 family protein [Coraliomargarita sinensis]|nr:nuclear transport factor 2 family protein [Coraliomargarita sinensis]
MIHTQTVPDDKYNAALEWTDPSNHEVPAEGSDSEAEMLNRVRALFTNYTEENLRENVTRVYAEEVYFRDAFKQFARSTEIRDYFVHGLKPLKAAEFEFRRIIRSGDEFYIDWLMRLDFEKTPDGSWEESIGMTHMRFNADGKIIFHQDYWDPTDIVYKRIPVAKQLINFVKKKM